MNVTEVLGKFSLYREPPLSLTATTFIKNPVLVKPISHNADSVASRPRMMMCRCSVDAKSVGGEMFSVTSSNKCDVDYLGQSTKGDLNLKLEHLEAFGNGQVTLEGPIEEVARLEAKETEDLLGQLGIPVQ